MAGFALSRSVRIAADPDRVHDLVDDFRQWPLWSPWEGIDPDLERSYTGPDRGVGARYEWRGNSRAGEGSMEIAECDPAHVVVDLRFVRPFRATNVSRFDVASSGGGTEVTWTMTGQRSTLMAAMGRLFFDRTLGRDLEKGLARLKAAAEAGSSA